MSHVVELIGDGAGADQVRAVRERFAHLVTDGRFDRNGRALRRCDETIEDASDPNGILAPGKSGIWPKAMRDGR